jgi:serine/threonine protein kinase
MTEQFIGNYRVLKKIGAGGMAQVYLAVHKDVPNLKVVLKILSDARLVERFRQEADKLALLDGHGNVCRIKHFFNHGDDFVIAMEYIDGTTLEDIIERDKKIPIDDSIRIISEVLSTLEFAHQKDIFHRDIKPGNIMVDARNQIKIIDFGIAKGKTDPNLTVAGTSCGTPAYMPPEQFNPTEEIDYALVDVYAVGTTLFFMLTGELPFKGDNQFALRDAKMFNDPIGPRKINPDIPKQIEQVILKALAKDPKDRYSSAAEMKAALDSLKDKKESHEPVQPDGKPVSPPHPPKIKATSKSIPFIAAAVVIVCAAIVYLVFIRGSEPGLPPTPTPLTPEQNAILDNSLPSFVWERLADVEVAYIVEYASDSTFNNTIEKRIVAGTDYTPAEPLADGRYFWRVYSQDGRGIESPPSMILQFTVEAATEAIPEATLAISVTPQGDIYIDGELHGQGQSTANVTLDTGQHIVRVVNRESRQQELSETVYLADGAEENVNFRFTFQAPLPKPDSGDVSIGSRPIDGAVVIIDGKVQDDRTNFTFRQPVGEHEIEVVLNLDGEELSITKTVEFKKDSVLKEWFDFENKDN